MLARNIYYRVKPFIPRRLQISLRREIILRQRRLHAGIWPIDERAGRPPDGWTGWPEGKRFALVLTHDVDTEKGQERCLPIVDIERALGFRSCFNFVPERYPVSPGLRSRLMEEGFEVGVHGLRHDGDLYRSRKVFLEHAVLINRYLQEWGAVGFRSPAMHHNLDWIHDLDIEYDMSTFDTDPFEPQPDGVSTIFPFTVEKDSGRKRYVELPYTLAQDFTLFILMQEKGIDVWRRKLDWVAKKGGMALVNVHPDYMKFGVEKPGLEEYPARYYEELLEYVLAEYEGEFFHALPQQVARFWLSRTRFM